MLAGGKIGILTGGGDVPGLNPVIKSVGTAQAKWAVTWSAFARDGRV
jgi:6-phosphofructokinase